MEPTRKIQLTFVTEGKEGERIPLYLLAQKLSALQKLVFHAAASAARYTGPRRGRWESPFRACCELQFEDVHHSDLTVEASLPDIYQTELVGPDLGRRALDTLFQVATLVAENRIEETADLFRDRQGQGHFLRTLEELCPRQSEGYSIRIGNGTTARPAIALKGETGGRIRAFLYMDVSTVLPKSEMTLVGELVKIHVDTGARLIAVKTDKGNEIPCYYDELQRDTITALVAGSTVEVRGTYTTDSDGGIRSIDTITSVEMIEMEPLRLSEVKWNNRTYRFKKSLPFDMEYSDGVWIYENAQINVLAFTTERESAVREIAENLDNLYREIAEEKDSCLDSKARELKARMIELIEVAAA